jgi:drug/metabolite transporter (DMT)-like permease
LTARKLMCVACGFAGVGLVMAPSGQETVDWRLRLALASAFSFALYLVATKRLAHDIQASTLMLSDGLLGSLAAAAVLALGDLLAPGNAVITLATVPTAAGITLAMLAGAVGTLSSLLVIKAMRLAPASVIAPLGYLEIVSAAAIGVFIFHDPLTFAAVTGAALIVMSCWVASSSTKREPPVQKQDP